MRWIQISFLLAMMGLVPVNGVYWNKFCAVMEYWWLRDVQSPDPINRIANMETLAPACEVDVGTCPEETCSTNTRRYASCPDDGYVCPETETRIADCQSSGMISYEYVLRCVCCKVNGVIGIVKDADTADPLGHMILFIGGKLSGYSGADGKFETIRKPDVLSIVVKAKDPLGNYLDAVRVVQVPADFQDYLYVELFMIKKADKFEIDSTVTNVLSLSNNPLDPSSGDSVIEIEPDSFQTFLGEVYSGPISTQITFIHPDDMNDQTTPGEFVTTDGQPLITNGVVSFTFRGADNQRLQLAKPVLFTSQIGMKLWNLDTTVGRWELMDIVSGRRKRQASPGDWVSIDIEGEWINIDIIFGFPSCYFKVRVFTQSNEEVSAENSVLYQPKIKAETPTDNVVFLVTFESTNDPSSRCYETKCRPDVSTDYSGLLKVSKSSITILDGDRALTSTDLIPRPLSDYSASIQAKLNDVDYELNMDGVSLNVSFVSSDDGPFYTNLDVCTSSTGDMPAFHFILPP